MIWCETEQNDFPDREFFTADGVLMHRSRRDGPHPAAQSVRFELPEVGEARDEGRDG
jgi:hypothetical protein